MDYCVVCGGYCPEGRMVCYKCEHINVKLISKPVSKPATKH